MTDGVGTDGISENFSENKKRGRGRPSIFKDGGYELLKQIHCDVTTKRSLRNKFHITPAYRVISEIQKTEPTRWNHIINPVTRRIRWVLLYELGQLPVDKIPEVADWICAEKRPIKDVLQALRTYRKQLKESRL
jgi:hypothetical protein